MSDPFDNIFSGFSNNDDVASWGLESSMAIANWEAMNEELEQLPEQETPLLPEDDLTDDTARPTPPVAANWSSIFGDDDDDDDNDDDSTDEGEDDDKDTTSKRRRRKSKNAGFYFDDDKDDDDKDEDEEDDEDEKEEEKADAKAKRRRHRNLQALADAAEDTSEDGETLDEGLEAFVINSGILEGPVEEDGFGLEEFNMFGASSAPMVLSVSAIRKAAFNAKLDLM